MTVEIIRDVLAWCSVINVGLLLILGIRVYAGPRLDLSNSWEMVQVVSGEVRCFSLLRNGVFQDRYNPVQYCSLFRITYCRMKL